MDGLRLSGGSQPSTSQDSPNRGGCGGSNSPGSPISCLHGFGPPYKQTRSSLSTRRSFAGSDTREFPYGVLTPCFRTDKTLCSPPEDAYTPKKEPLQVFQAFSHGSRPHKSKLAAQLLQELIRLFQELTRIANCRRVGVSVANPYIEPWRFFGT